MLSYAGLISFTAFDTVDVVMGKVCGHLSKEVEVRLENGH